MVISEVIAKLESLMNEHGDIEVFAYGSDEVTETLDEWSFSTYQDGIMIDSTALSPEAIVARAAERAEFKAAYEARALEVDAAYNSPGAIAKRTKWLAWDMAQRETNPNYVSERNRNISDANA